MEPKSMPKLVPTKMRNIIKNKIFLNGKIIQIRCKTMLFDVSKIACANGKISRQHQQIYQSPLRNRWKINLESLLAKVMQQWWKMEAKLEPKSTKYEKQTRPKINAKKERVRQDMPGGQAARAGAPSSLLFSFSYCLRPVSVLSSPCLRLVFVMSHLICFPTSVVVLLFLSRHRPIKHQRKDRSAGS